MRELTISVQNVAGWLDLGVVASALRADGEGVLNLESIRELDLAVEAARRVASAWSGRFLVKIESEWSGSLELLRRLPSNAATLVIVPGSSSGKTKALVGAARESGRDCRLEVVSSQQAALGVSLGVSALIAKGHESGGRVGEEGTFVLLQRLIAETQLPVWAHGGIGPNSAAACLAAGAAGVVLDSQLLLTPESTIPASVRAALSQMQGEETASPGGEQGAMFRFFRRANMPAAEALLKLASTAGEDSWRQALEGSISWTAPDTAVWPLGQDAVLAAPLAAQFFNVAGIVAGLKSSARALVDAAHRLTPLAAGSPLAVSHKLTYPIFQGPMTRVSDVAEFAGAVASNGALPFLALALLRAPEARSLLERTKDVLAGRSWGVGILGFVEPGLRAEQLEVVRAVKPPFAIIAGGRPDQARLLEESGIPTYLHIPAPSLLRMFIEDGARRFVFEGRECGGHVGPRTSFVLWESMIASLLEAIASGVPAAELHVVFAGGIHDARSAAMVSALAAPLAEKGVRIAILMGTAYLFTREAVETGAIVEGFQRAALECRETISLESGPGHVTRCADTPYNKAFLAAKRELTGKSQDSAAVKEELEKLNLGRLRLAAKGVMRENDAATGAPVYRAASDAEQLEQGMYMIGQVAALRNEVCSMRELHESVCAGSTRVLREAASSSVAPPHPTPRSAAPLDLAIVGMSCLLPGAPDLRTFWKNVLAGKDAITEIPAARFNADLYFHPDKSERDKVYSRWGGFLDPVAFDPIRLGIPPAALGSIDPLQLLSLLAAEQALEDAGYGRQREFRRERASVILGLSGGLGDLGIDLALRSNLPQYLQGAPPGLYERLPEWTEDSFAGILLNVAAGRIANRLNLGGVNVAVDAACASAMAAVYMAAGELRSGASDLVVVGGCDTVQSPFGFLCFSKSQALSPTGRCRPFDSAADGIAISEGVAMLVLKRVADAERAGDRIYAVLKGVGGSSDGRGRSMTAPRREGQVSAIRRAYEQAGFSAAGIGLIEAHGTGTVAGDETETASLTEVFAADGAARQSCVVGSVKSMVGHTKAAAGVTGLVKVALSLHHRVLPPTLHVENPNPKLREASTPFHVLTHAQPWPEPLKAEPRRAGVSSFGFGGTNFHAALEEYRGDVRSPQDRCSARDWPAELFLWRAANLPALEAQLAPLAVQLATAANPPLPELAEAINRRAASGGAGASRLAVIARTVSELAARVESVRQAIARGETRLNETAPSVYLTGNAQESLPIAFLFPGQGSQFPGMLRELALYLPEFNEYLSRADEALSKNQDARRLSSYVYPPPSFDEADRKLRMAEITRTTVAQPALALVEIALCRALERFGVKAAMTAGHSFGEYVALAASGVIGEDDLFRIAAARGRAIEGATARGADSGTMAAVAADAETTKRALGAGGEVAIANLNSSRQTIIAGPVAAIKQAAARLEEAGLTTQPIPVACAFHSPLMAPAAGELAAALESLEMKPARLRVFSNTTANPYPAGVDEMRSLLARHLVEPVQFMAEITAMYDAGARVFVEIGPKAVLTNLTRQILAGRADWTVLSADPGDRGLGGFLALLGQLFTMGVDVRPDELCRARVTRVSSVEELCEAPKPANWFVNGARAYPASKPYRALPPIEIRQAVQAPAAAPAAALPAVAPASPPALAGPHADAAMLQFQQLMAQFLQSQSAVMTAYLGGGAAPLHRPMPPLSLVGEEAKVSANLAGLDAAVKVSDQPPPRAPQATSLPAAAWDGEAALLRIASERTGYPPDLLDLDAGIEADLGIDSIKRVEILTALQRQLPANLQSAMKASMEKLTRARSLNDIAALLPVATGPVAKPESAESSVDCESELLRITSERTGYPPDLLDLDAGIEADLGIDSIKRVEILTALQRRLPTARQSAMKASMEKLTRARSLREIVGLLSASTEPEASAASSEVPRFRLALQELAVLTAQPRFHAGRVVVITDDESGLASRLAASLDRGGEQAVILQHGLEAAAPSASRVIADLTDPQAVDLALEAIRKLRGPIGAIVHLLPWRPDLQSLDLAQPLEQWRAQLHIAVRSLYLLTRSAQPDLDLRGTGSGALLATVTARGGDFSVGQSSAAAAASPLHQMTADFVKTAALELSAVTCKVIDLDATDPLPILHQKLLDEITSTDGIVQIGRPGDRRLTVAPQVAPILETKAVVDRDSVIVLTGGARGITSQVARLLAQRQPALILVGSAPVPEESEPAETAGIGDVAALKSVLLAKLRAARPNVRAVEVDQAVQRLLRGREITRTIDDLRLAGARVEYHCTDVRDEAAMTALMQGIYDRHGRIDVFVHGAGIIEDKLIRDKMPESFDRVIHTKADSTFLLARLLRPESLRAFVLMSSITAVFGNRGQADYAAANGLLNGFAAALSGRWPGRVVAMCWGPWDQGGMVTGEVRRQFRERGIPLIPPDGGAAAVLREIESTGRQDAIVALGEGPWSATALPDGTLTGKSQVAVAQ